MLFTEHDKKNAETRASLRASEFYDSSEPSLSKSKTESTYYANIARPKVVEPVIDLSKVLEKWIPVAKLVKTYYEKSYIFGFLKISEIFEIEGDVVSQLESVKDIIMDMNYSIYLAEIKGPNMRFWPANDFGEATLEKITELRKTDPGILRMLDCSVETLENSIFLDEALALRFAGSKTILMQPAAAEKEGWVSAIRLSCYENGKINEIYTVERFTTEIGNTVSRYPKPSFCGEVRVFHLGDSNWKKMACYARNGATSMRERFLKENQLEESGEMIFFQAMTAKKELVFAISHIILVHFLSPDFTSESNSGGQCIRIEGNVIFGKKFRKNERNGHVDYVVLQIGSFQDLCTFFKSIVYNFNLHVARGGLESKPIRIQKPPMPPQNLYLEIKDVVQGTIDPSLLLSKKRYEKLLQTKQPELFRRQPDMDLARDLNTALAYIPEENIENQKEEKQKWVFESSEESSEKINDENSEEESGSDDIIDRSDVSKDSEDEPIGPQLGIKEQKKEVIPAPDMTALEKVDYSVATKVEEEEIVVPTFVKFGGLLARPTKEIRQQQAVQQRQEYYVKLQQQQRKMRFEAEEKARKEKLLNASTENMYNQLKSQRIKEQEDVEEERIRVMRDQISSSDADSDPKVYNEESDSESSHEILEVSRRKRPSRPNSRQIQ